MSMLFSEGDLRAMGGTGGRAFLLACFFACTAQATTVSSATLQIDNSQYVRSSEQYFRDGAGSSQTSYKFGWQGMYEKGPWIATAKLRDDFMAEENHHYAKPFEIYVGRNGDRFWGGFGRRTDMWSVADEFWGLGVWQPRFLDDKINRESAGFSGAFFGVKGDRVSATVHASPWFLPDMGPDCTTKNSEFVAANPWFHPPSNRLILSGQDMPIYYKLDRPAEKDVIENAVIAAKLEYRPMTTRFARFGMTRKPMNQLLMGGPINLHITSPYYASVDVVPTVVYHQVATLEAGVSGESQWNFWSSLSYEKIESDDRPTSWITQQADNSTIGSVYVGYKLDDFSDREIYASYLRVLGGDGPDKSPFVTENPIFETRYMFIDALKIGARNSGLWLSKRWRSHLDTSFTYDFAQHGILASVKFTQGIAKYWNMFVSADGIGLLDQSARVSNGFFSYYRANDRVALGVNYAF